MITRADKSSGNFTAISNEVVLDKRLSFKAKGILLYMLSRPDDWQFYEDEIATNTNDGLASVRAGVKELMEYGYVVRTQRREKGRFSKYEYAIYEQATEMRKSQVGEAIQYEENSTEMRLSENGKTENGKSHPTNTDITKTDNTKKENNGAITGAIAPHYNGSPDGKRNNYFSLNEVLDKEYTCELNLEGNVSNGILACMEWYGRLYKHLKGVEHPRLKLEQVQRVHDTLQHHYAGYTDYTEVYSEWLKASAIVYFQNVKKCDHNINHFATSGILETREYEAPYMDIDEDLMEL